MTTKQVDTSNTGLGGEKVSNPMESYYNTNSEMYNNEWSVKLIIELLVKSLVSDGLLFIQDDKFVEPVGRVDIVMQRLVLPALSDAIRQKALTGIVVYAICRITKLDSIGRTYPQLLGFPYPKVLEEGQYGIDKRPHKGSILRKLSSVASGLRMKDVFIFEYNLLSCRTASLDTILANMLKPLVNQLANLEASMMAWERSHGKPPILLSSDTNIAKNLTSNAMDPTVDSTLEIFNETGETYIGADALNYKRMENAEKMNSKLNSLTKTEVKPSWKYAEEFIRMANTRIFLPDGFGGTLMSPSTADSTYVLRREELLKSMYHVAGFTMKTRKRANDRRTDEQPQGARDLSEQTISQWGAMIHQLLEEMLPQMWKRLSNEQQIYEDGAPPPKRDKDDENVYHVHSMGDLITLDEMENDMFDQSPADKVYIEWHKSIRAYLKSALLSDPIQAMNLLKKGMIDEQVYQAYFPDVDLSFLHEDEEEEGGGGGGGGGSSSQTTKKPAAKKTPAPAATKK
jgi:hypothetical protein